MRRLIGLLLLLAPWEIQAQWDAEVQVSGASSLSVQIPQDPGGGDPPVPPESLYMPFAVDFTATDPVLACQWRSRDSGIYEYVLNSPNFVTGKTTEPVRLSWAHGSMDGQSGSAVLKLNESNDTFDHHGVLVRNACNGVWDDRKHIQITMRGSSGQISLGLYTGNVQDFKPCNHCAQATSLAADSYIGFTWQGDDRQLVVKAWNFGATPPSDFFDPSTWGPCQAGIFDQGPNPGCTSIFQVTITPGYSSGTCFGVVHQDTSGAPLNENGIEQAWFNNL